MARPTVRGLRRFRGATLIEMIAALTMIAFVAGSTVSLYWTGQLAHRRARFYSEAQTDIRSALRQVTRVIRSSSSVLGTGTQGNLSGLTSNSNQIVVSVPQGASAPIQCRYYVSNGVLYQQRSDQAAPGTVQMQGVTSLTFLYYRTLVGTRSSMDANPSYATEVEVRVAAQRVSVSTSLTTYVALRDALAGG